MTEEKMFEIPEWLAKKLIELLTLELEQTREALQFKELELDRAYGELIDLRNKGGDTE